MSSAPPRGVKAPGMGGSDPSSPMRRGVGPSFNKGPVAERFPPGAEKAHKSRGVVAIEAPEPAAAREMVTGDSEGLIARSTMLPFPADAAAAAAAAAAATAAGGCRAAFILGFGISETSHGQAVLVGGLAAQEA